MDLVGLGLAWDELEVGYKFKTIGRTITEADLVNFITCTGMLEVLFTDVQYVEEQPGIRHAAGHRCQVTACCL